MKIKVKLYANFRELLPKDANAEGWAIDIDADTTINDVLRLVRVPTERAHLVLINGVYIPPENRDEAIFNEGDVLAVWPQVAGG